MGFGCGALLGWMALAVYFDFSLLGPPWLRAGLGVLVLVGALVALWLVRPRRWAFAGILGAFVVVLAAWLAIPPSNERDWQPDVATLAFADVHGDRVIVHNVRNAEYRTETDYTVRLEDRDAGPLAAPLPGCLPRPLGIAPHRPHDHELGVRGRPVPGHLDRDTEGEGRAVLRAARVLSPVRARLRGRGRARRRAPAHECPRRGRPRLPARRAPRGRASCCCSATSRRSTSCASIPQWYNALTDNCTTAIQRLARTGARRSWWSWKLFLNGYLDELAYDIGAIDRSLPFTVLQGKSHINERAKAANDDPRFSVRIRDGLPRMSLDRRSEGVTP